MNQSTAINWLLVFTTHLISISLQAQVTEVRFERISINEGLSQSSVFAIVQDHQGFMWFGTQDGLNKYDGYRFTVYRSDPDDSMSLSNNTVSRLMVDRVGKIWAGTSGGGLNCFDPETGRFRRFLHNPADSNTVSHNRIWSLSEDRAGTLWVGTQSGLNSYDKQTGRWRRYYLRPEDKSHFDNSVWAVFQDSLGTYWVDCGRAIYTFDPRRERFALVQLESAVNRFLVDSEGRLWSYGHRASTYNARRNRFRSVRLRGPSGEAVDVGGEAFIRSRLTGEYWFGTYNGLVRSDRRNKVAERFVHNPIDPETLSENTVLSLAEDRSGIVWVGTYQGINKYVPTKKRFEFYTHNARDENSLSSISVRGFAEDHTGSIWIATQKGINRFDPLHGRFYRLTMEKGISLSKEFFWCIGVEKTFPPITVWAGANGPGAAILRLDGGELSVSTIGVEHLSNTSVTAFFEDRSGDLWFGQLEGATWYRREASTYVSLASLPNAPAGLKSMTITFIDEDRNGFLWFGTYASGLLKFDRVRGEFKHYTHLANSSNSLSDNNVISFHEDSEGILWIGTYRGLNRFDPTLERFRNFTTAHGLPNDVIYGILEDDHGNLWISSNKGLTSFNKTSGRSLSYDIGDGLQSNEFNQGARLKARDGAMYFGGINGFNKFHPDSISTNPNIPVVVFTDFKIFNKTVESVPGGGRILGLINTLREIQLSHSDAVLTFEFAALEFTAPQRNQYAYYMEGFEPGWNAAGEKREATYTNLDPGEYVFRVKASNNDGVWNEEGASLRVTIAPPWWMTWWFQGLAVVGFLSIGPIIYVRRVSGLRKEHALQQEISRRLIESQETERMRIAAELHDGLGQDLLIISNRAQMAQDKTKAPAWVDEQLREISETVSQAIQDVRTIAHNLRPYQIDRIGLTKGIESIIKNISGSTAIRIRSEIDRIDGLFPRGQEIHVFRVVQESVNNIIKHSQALEAGIAIKKTIDYVQMTIWDNGKGFDASVIGTPRSGGHGFGLAGIQERVRIVGGTVEVVSAPEKGTRIVIRLPITGTQT